MAYNSTKQKAEDTALEQREVTLGEVLAFRDEKAGIQETLLEQNPAGCVVSLGMNIPGPVKRNEAVQAAFEAGRAELARLIADQGGQVRQEAVLLLPGGCAAACLVLGAEPLALKRAAVALEETHPLGRLFDLDVLGQDRLALSRTAVGAQGRKCLLCGGDAKACGRSRSHPVQALQARAFGIIAAWREAL